MVNSGILPSQIENEDYFELLEIMNAKDPAKQPMNAEDAHKKLAQMFGH